MPERSDVYRWGITYTCPVDGRKHSRSQPMAEITGTQYRDDGSHIAFVISDCPCGEEHEIYVCPAGEIT